MYESANEGVDQLSEEGAIRVFRPLFGSDIIIGAVGILRGRIESRRAGDALAFHPIDHDSSLPARIKLARELGAGIQAIQSLNYLT